MSSPIAPNLAAATKPDATKADATDGPAPILLVMGPALARPAREAIEATTAWVAVPLDAAAVCASWRASPLIVVDDEHAPAVAAALDERGIPAAARTAPTVLLHAPAPRAAVLTRAGWYQATRRHRETVARLALDLAAGHQLPALSAPGVLAPRRAPWQVYLAALSEPTWRESVACSYCAEPATHELPDNAFDNRRRAYPSLACRGHAEEQERAGWRVITLVERAAELAATQAREER